MKELALPEKVREIGETLNKAGYEAFLVGGAVRDLLLGRPTTDWDFTTSAVPEKIIELFPESFYDNVFGTVGLKSDDGHKYEITTFRTEQGYADRRHPTIVTWGKTLKEDLQRREFTISALCIQIKNSKLKVKSSNLSNDIIDLHGGLDDLKNKIIRCIGDPNQRFQEDALRMMRAIRFACQLGFTIEEKTFAAIKNNAVLIREISSERIRDELIKILGSDYPSEGILFLHNAGILPEVLPELSRTYGVGQAKHHQFDVFGHLTRSLKFCPNKHWLVRFATLMHDVGKPLTAHGDGQQRTFYNHEVVGARLAREIADRLHFTKEDREQLFTLIRWHMFSVSEFLTDSAVRRFIRRIGQENIETMIDLRVGDRLGGGDTPPTSWRLELFKKRLIEVQQHTPSVKDLKVNGLDVMEILGVKPGPIIGKILNTLFEEITENPEKNEKEYLVKRIKEMENL